MEPRTCDALLDGHVRYANLVYQIAVGRDGGIFGLASQHINRARCLIVFSKLVREKRTGNRIGNSSARFVLVQRSLKRAHEHIAFGAIVENHAKTRVGAPLGVCEHVANFGDVSFLPANDKPATWPDLRLQLEWACFPNARLNVLLKLLKERLESGWLKVLPPLSTSRMRGAMSDLDLDELGSELDDFAQPKKKGGRSPREERIIAGFEEIQAFVEKHGHSPQHGEDRDIFERLYAVRLDRLRALEECRSLLGPLDHQGLLANVAVESAAPVESMDEDELLAELDGAAGSSDITELRHVRTSADKRAAEEIANRQKCEDFDRFPRHLVS